MPLAEQRQLDNTEVYTNLSVQRNLDLKYGSSLVPRRIRRSISQDDLNKQLYNHFVSSEDRNYDGTIKTDWDVNSSVNMNTEMISASLLYFYFL